MKHIEGNSPHCWECFYYAEKQPNDGCLGDGWCVNPHQLAYGVNGRKRAVPLMRYSTNRNNECTWWEDAETRDSHFDVVTGKYREKLYKDVTGRQIQAGDIVRQSTKKECQYIGVPDMYIAEYEVVKDKDELMLEAKNGKRYHFLASCQYEIIDQLKFEV